MKPTETLMAEHRIIEKGLDAIQKALERAANSDFDTELFEKALDFFRRFADKRHHGKEEDRLFPAMEARGLPRDSGPVACMLSEHDMGRGLLKAVDENLPAAREGDEKGRRKVLENFREYLAFLREHIAKEDGVLFPMADEILSEKDQAMLGKEFAGFDDRDGGEELHRKYAAIADKLRKKSLAGLENGERSAE